MMTASATPASRAFDHAAPLGYGRQQKDRDVGIGAVPAATADLADEFDAAHAAHDYSRR